MQTMKFKIDLDNIKEQLNKAKQTSTKNNKSTIATLEKSFTKISQEINKVSKKQLNLHKKASISHISTQAPVTRNSFIEKRKDSPIRKFVQTCSQWCNESTDTVEVKPYACKLKNLLRYTPQVKSIEPKHKHKSCSSHTKFESDKCLFSLVAENKALKERVERLTNENILLKHNTVNL